MPFGTAVPGRPNKKVVELLVYYRPMLPTSERCFQSLMIHNTKHFTLQCGVQCL